MALDTKQIVLLALEAGAEEAQCGNIRMGFAFRNAEMLVEFARLIEAARQAGALGDPQKEGRP